MGEAEPFTEVDVFPQVPSAEDVEEFWPKPEEEQKSEESKPSPGPGSESGQTPEPEQEKPEGGERDNSRVPTSIHLTRLNGFDPVA